MKAINPAEFAPTAVDDRFDTEMNEAHRALWSSRYSEEEISYKLASGRVADLDEPALALPCRYFPLPSGPLSPDMIRNRLRLLLFVNGASALHEHLETVFGLAPIEDRDVDIHDMDVWYDAGPSTLLHGEMNLTQRLWTLSKIAQPFVRAMLEGHLGWAQLLGRQAFEKDKFADTGETVAGILETVAPFWLFADLQMAAYACWQRCYNPKKLPFWEKEKSTGIPKLFRAIKLMEERLDTFETVRDLYFRDLRRPVTSPVPSTSLLSGSAQTLASVAALNVTLSVYGLSASKDETKQFEQDGTAAKARGLLLTWRQEHGDNLESFIEAQMTRAIVALDRTRKRLERLKQVKGFSNLDLASYDDTRPRARLVLACEQAAAWMPAPALPLEQRPKDGKAKLVSLEYKCRPSPIRQMIDAIDRAIDRMGPCPEALKHADIQIPARKNTDAQRVRDLNFVFANLIVEEMPQRHLLTRWDTSGDRRSQPERRASNFRKQAKKQPLRNRNREVLKEARGSLAWRFQEAGPPDAD